MSGGLTDPALLLAALLLAAVLLAWLRLWRWQNGGARALRFWVLMAAQPIVALLIWLLAGPERLPASEGTLRVATAGAAGPLGPEDVRLPEADVQGGRAFPDLASALRARGRVARIEVLGTGLEARDLAAARGLGIGFEAPALPRGVVALSGPGAVAAGGRLRLSGRVQDVPGGQVRLLDPAGAEAARVKLAVDGGFALGGLVRAAGAADWQLELLDADGGRVERLPVPVVAAAPAPVRMLVAAGAPGPELKFLQRWAADAGLAAAFAIEAGGGVVLGGSDARLDAARLARLDVLVLDERRWAALSGGERAAVRAAVAGGLGLVLRVTGPVPDAVRRDWAGLAPALAGSEAAPRRLAEGAVVQALPIRPGEADVALLTDGERAVSAWRALGRGRVALWPVLDAYELVLAGEAARFQGLWSEMVARVARPVPGLPVIMGPGFAGDRMEACGLGPDARVAAADGTLAPLLVDGRGCAGIWPQAAGWLRLLPGGDRSEVLVRVLPADAWPGIRAVLRAEATAALATAQATADAGGSGAAALGAAPAGLLLAGLVLLLGGLWWLERRREMSRVV